ncbi:MAG: hypothetical protein L0227_00055 [Chloroflexi bacterium]|nr:hypothetical protein [Chloroflexota bacterium]
MIRFDDTWFIGANDAQEERNRMHLEAIREARIATEYREATAQAARLAGPRRRFALATAGSGSSIDLCASCA